MTTEKKQIPVEPDFLELLKPRGLHETADQKRGGTGRSHGVATPVLWTSRAGATSRVKRRTRRRERREGKREVLEDLPPGDEFLAWLDMPMSERYWIERKTEEVKGEARDESEARSGTEGEGVGGAASGGDGRAEHEGDPGGHGFIGSP